MSEALWRRAWRVPLYQFEGRPAAFDLVERGADGSDWHRCVVDQEPGQWWLASLISDGI